LEGSERDRARRLPAGAHGIPSELVARNQRERLIAAVAEACAEGGYAETSIADLAQRASVSTATFYKLFAGKSECVLEAHEELVGRLLEEVDAACAEAPEEERLRAGVRAVLELFAADPETARLLTVEILALGPRGGERNDAAVESFTARLRACRADADPGPVATDSIVVAGIAARIGSRVLRGDAGSLPELEDELVALLSR
jgi:AcrR family transcriptional regulator